MSDKVKRMCLRDKLSLYEMSKRTGLSCNMQRKWLKNPKETAPPRYQSGVGANQAERLSPGIATLPRHAACSPGAKFNRQDGAIFDRR